RHEARDHPDRHDLGHFLFGPEYGRVLAGFFEKSRHQPHHQEANGKRRDRAAERRQPETRIVHVRPLAGTIYRRKRVLLERHPRPITLLSPRAEPRATIPSLLAAS